MRVHLLSLILVLSITIIIFKNRENERFICVMSILALVIAIETGIFIHNLPTYNHTYDKILNIYTVEETDVRSKVENTVKTHHMNIKFVDDNAKEHYLFRDAFYRLYADNMMPRVEHHRFSWYGLYEDVYIGYNIYIYR